MPNELRPQAMPCMVCAANDAFLLALHSITYNTIRSHVVSATESECAVHCWLDTEIASADFHCLYMDCVRNYIQRSRLTVSYTSRHCMFIIKTSSNIARLTLSSLCITDTRHIPVVAIQQVSSMNVQRLSLYLMHPYTHTHTYIILHR